MIYARTSVDLASQNAPAVIASTGTYPDRMPGPEDFTAVYGAEEGGKRLQAFNVMADIGRQVFDMRPVPNQAIHARLRDVEAGPDSLPEERARYEITDAAARLIMTARRADPAGYVRQLFPNADADWNKISKPEDYQAAIARSVSAQQEMGFDNIQPLPQSVARDLAKKYNDESTPRRQRVTALSEIFLTVRDPAVRAAMANQVLLSSLSQISQDAANNPNVTAADVQAQAEALTVDLSAIAQNPARAQYDAMPLLLQPLVAADDVVRLMANGMTIGHADKVSAGLGSLFSSKSYEELLAAERAATEDAKDRAGSAAIPAELLGAAIAGHGLASAGITLTGRFGTAAMEGLPGLAARTALASAEGAVYGATYAHGQDQDILSGAGAGALWGVGGNILAEGIGVIGRQVVAKFARRPADVDPAASPEPTTSLVSEAVPEPLAVEGEAAAGGGSHIAVGHDLHMRYMRKWNDAQREAAGLKAQRLTDSETSVNHHSVRDSKPARRKYIEAGNEVAPNEDVDHIVDLQLNGQETLSNFSGLDMSVNRSFGAQIKNQIKSLPQGTRINKVTIGDR